MSAKPKYRLKSANEHNLVFEPVTVGVHNAYPTALYLVPRYVWARWMRGDYP